jgi:hypothetical protein
MGHARCLGLVRTNVYPLEATEVTGRRRRLPEDGDGPTHTKKKRAERATRTHEEEASVPSFTSLLTLNRIARSLGSPIVAQIDETDENFETDSARPFFRVPFFHVPSCFES